ncbi:MAG: P27 family phage terminase small subunit [Lachnospiraceae bacterium]
MARKAESLEGYRLKVKKDMQKLGTYKVEFMPLIDIYSELLHRHACLMKKWETEDFEYEESTAAGGTKKATIVLTIETLRKDILAYSDRLQLNPKSLNSEPQSKTEVSEFRKFMTVK